MNRLRAMPAPGLEWQAGLTPASSRFGDIYFSRDGGLDQARHVFLDGCDLPEAWAGGQQFTVGELGFGTGLNFLATWALWRQSAPPGARLHYIAVEGFPLLRDELEQCLAAWPELQTFVRDLLRVYPPAQPGFHRLFPAPDVTLTLLYGEAAAMLTQIEACVDAWYLDGFAPEKNPEMWSAEVLTEVARLSRPDARLATYSVAGDVRRGLEAVGFEVHRSPGFGHKREMLKARFRGSASVPRLQPWFARAQAHTPARAVIIGAGIAGASVAHALQRRGWKSVVIDQGGALAGGASGNPAAVLLPRLTASPNLDGRFYAGAYRFLLAHLEALSFDFERCGVLQLATDAQEAARQDAVAAQGPLPEPWVRRVDAAEASAIAGVHVPHSALHFPHSGWISPRALCAALTAESDVRLGQEAATLTYDGVWRVRDELGEEIAQGEIVVLANAQGAARFAQTAGLPLLARRGQITLAPPTAASASLRTVLSYGGYITPAAQGTHNIGATFEDGDAPDVRAADHQHNLGALADAVPALGTGWDGAAISGRASVRCTTLDHMPMVGPIPARDSYLRDFADLAHGHPWARYPQATYLPGLFALTGLASRGMVSAPLAAEVLAAEICGEPWALERDLVTALHPARFIVRDLKRRA